MSRAKIFYELWKPTDRRFKIGGVMMFIFFVADVVVSTISFRHVEALLRIEMLIAFAEAAVIYILLLPPIMHRIHRDIQRGRTDVVDFTILFLFFHLVVTNMFKLTLASGT
jgi:hypothetical protein